jgi:hypothetical protein
MRWQFRPFIVQGVPVQVEMILTIARSTTNGFAIWPMMVNFGRAEP